MIRIQHITTESAELEKVRQLFLEYVRELDEDLCFQSFDEELKNPLYKYGTPFGGLLLAYWNNEAVGCVALQPLKEQGVCEMKRLYVQPDFRKHKIGEMLVTEIVKQAQQIGYTKMKLDTLDKLQAAIHLYKKHGFVETTSYYHNPLPGVVYMEKILG
jgi:ribosomal protein S18 acetylase RimI-like enzyme